MQTCNQNKVSIRSATLGPPRTSRMEAIAGIQLERGSFGTGTEGTASDLSTIDHAEIHTSAAMKQTSCSLLTLSASIHIEFGITHVEPLLYSFCVIPMSFIRLSVAALPRFPRSSCRPMTTPDQDQESGPPRPCLHMTQTTLDKNERSPLPDTKELT